MIEKVRRKTAHNTHTHTQRERVSKIDTDRERSDRERVTERERKREKKKWGKYIISLETKAQFLKLDPSSIGIK